MESSEHKLGAVIVDDHRAAIENLEALLHEIDGIKVLATTTEASEAAALTMRFRPDILFLDIEMPGLDGFGVLHELKGQSFRPEIVFITSYGQYAIQAIRHAAFDFILKPVDPEELNTCIERFRIRKTDNIDIGKKYDQLIAALNYNTPLKFNTAGGFEMVQPMNIAWCEADGNYTYIHRHDQKVTLVTRNIKNIEEALSGKRFFRISRNHLINLDNLERFSRRKKEVILSSGTVQISLPVARSRVAELLRVTGEERINPSHEI